VWETLFLTDERTDNSRIRKGAEPGGGTTRLPLEARWPAGFPSVNACYPPGDLSSSM